MMESEDAWETKRSEEVRVIEKDVGAGNEART